MKHFLLFGVFLLFFITTQAQDIQILSPQDGNQITDTIKVTGSPNSDYSVNLWVYNASAHDLDIKAELDVFEQAKNCSYAYCWDNCYGNVRSGHVSGALTLAAGDTNKTALRLDYDPQGYEGYSLFGLELFADSTQDTATVYVSFQIKAGTPVIDQTQNIDIYPNPAKSVLIIHRNDTYNAHVQLVNLLGKTVLFKKFIGNELKIDVSKFEPGIYILILRGQSKTMLLRKVIINR